MRVENIGELGIFRQEAVTGMHGVSAGDLAGGNDLMDVQIAVTRRRRADADAFVCQAHMHRIGIGGRMNRNRRNSELLAGAQDAKCDFTAVGYEDLGNHGQGLTRR